MEFEHIEGQDRGRVVLYALSTCMWCKKTKALLSELGVAYDYVFVDLLDGNARDKTMTEVEKWNPRCSFPTLVVNDRCIIGFKEAEIREALG